MRASEILVFLPLAAAVHMGAWSIAPASIGASSPGGSGSAPVTLASAGAHHNALARSWQTAPQTAPELIQPTPATFATSQPAPNAFQAGPTLPRLPSLTPVLPAALPRIKPPAGSPVVQAPPAFQPQIDMADDRAPPRRQSDPNPQHARPVQPQASRPDAMARAETRPPAAPAKPQPAPRANPVAKPATPKPPSAPSQARSASGSRNAKARQSGQSGQDATQSANAATRNALRARWGAKIQRRVHRRLIYPREATGTGVAQVALTINKSGKMTGLTLTRSSGVTAFDQAALGAVRRAGQFPKAPDALREPSYSFTLSLSFRP